MYGSLFGSRLLCYRIELGRNDLLIYFYYYSTYYLIFALNVLVGGNAPFKTTFNSHDSLICT